MFSTRTSPSKWATDPALEAGMSAASPMTKTFGRALRLQGVLVGGNETQLVAETGGALHVRLAAVQRDTTARSNRTSRPS